jgi:HipA-like protein
MGRLRYAEIRFRGRRAGFLLETPGGGSVFEYADDIEGEVAGALPRDRRAHPWAAGVHPFFQHLGSEGWLRARQARAAALDDQDDLGLLLRCGADEPGPPPPEETLDALPTCRKWHIGGRARQWDESTARRSSRSAVISACRRAPWNAR